MTTLYDFNEKTDGNFAYVMGLGIGALVKVVAVALLFVSAISNSSMQVKFNFFGGTLFVGLLILCVTQFFFGRSRAARVTVTIVAIAATALFVPVFFMG